MAEPSPLRRPRFITAEAAAAIFRAAPSVDFGPFREDLDRAGSEDARRR